MVLRPEAKGVGCSVKGRGWLGVSVIEAGASPVYSCSVYADGHNSLGSISETDSAGRRHDRCMASKRAGCRFEAGRRSLAEGV